MVRPIVFAVSALALAACASPPPPVSKTAPAAAFSSLSPERTGSLRIAAVEVAFAEGAKIEWCEDDLGVCEDAAARIEETFVAALTKTGSSRGRPVVAIVTVTRFDSLTVEERARPSGVHDVNAIIRLADRETGETVAVSPDLDFDRIAFGAASARAALFVGRTQRARIAEKIGAVSRRWIGGLAART